MISHGINYLPHLSLISFQVFPFLSAKKEFLNSECVDSSSSSRSSSINQLPTFSIVSCFHISIPIVKDLEEVPGTLREHTSSIFTNKYFDERG